MPYSGEQQLIIAVIQSAVDDKDIEYFDSEQFDQHCTWLGITSVEGQQVIKENCLKHISANTKHKRLKKDCFD